MELLAKTRWMPVPQRFGAVLWLSFLMATAATGVFFSLLDPEDLRHCVPFPDISRTAAYSIGFLLFWLLTAASGLFAVMFTYPPRPDETHRGHD